jgi:hypothetical protein
METEPIFISGCKVGDIEIKKFKVDPYYVVMQLDNKKQTGKAITCISFDHAEYIMEGCIDRLTTWVN